MAEPHFAGWRCDVLGADGDFIFSINDLISNDANSVNEASLNSIGMETCLDSIPIYRGIQGVK